jgi:hypothetical protein
MGDQRGHDHHEHAPHAEGGAHAHLSAEGEARRALDYAGAALGLLCAVHCALTPLAVVLAPIAGLGVLWREEGEEALLWGLAALALVSALVAVWRSREWRVALSFAGALAVMFVGHEVLGHEVLAHEGLAQGGAEGGGAVVALGLSIAGGVGVMLTHLWSLRLQRARRCCVGLQ